MARWVWTHRGAVLPPVRYVVSTERGDQALGGPGRVPVPGTRGQRHASIGPVSRWSPGGSKIAPSQPGQRDSAPEGEARGANRPLRSPPRAVATVLGASKRACLGIRCGQLQFPAPVSVPSRSTIAHPALCPGRERRMGPATGVALHEPNYVYYSMYAPHTFVGPEAGRSRRCWTAVASRFAERQPRSAVTHHSCAAVVVVAIRWDKGVRRGGRRGSG